MNQRALALIPRLSYHDYEGVALNLDERERLVADLGDTKVMLLRNHGTLVMAQSLPEAFLKHWLLQRACEIQVAAGAAGTPVELSAEVIAVHQRDLAGVQLPVGPGVPDFQAMVRLIDRVDRSWRD